MQTYNNFTIYNYIYFLKPKKFGNFAPKTCFEPHVLLIPFQHFTNAILIHIIDAGSQEKSNPPVFVVGTVLQWLMESPCWGFFVWIMLFLSLLA